MSDNLERFELDRKLHDRVLQDHELDVVVGGAVPSASKQKLDGRAAGNVVAKWSLAQGAAA
jgi:hypothetical protein